MKKLWNLVIFVLIKKVGTVKIVERGQTNAVDAYLTPLIRDYINQFKSEFEDVCCLYLL